jgi:hypothetical protein
MSATVHCGPAYPVRLLNFEWEAGDRYTVWCQGPSGRTWTVTVTGLGYQAILAEIQFRGH